MSKVLSALGGALPDDRPLLSLQIVESIAKCPAGYWPVSRTYDEDSDAGLLKQNGLFGKKPSHYICLSKTEGVPGYVLDGVLVVGEREAAPAGYSVAGRAGKRRLCTRVSRAARPAGPAAPPAPPLTDVIVCSKMRTAPKGFVMAGEINGKVVCYKIGGVGSPTHNEYENVMSNFTPDAQRRLSVGPERPPKLSPLVAELNNLNLKNSSAAYPNIEELVTDHDYEALSPSYNVKPIRPAPRPPSAASPQNSPLARSPAAPAHSPAAPAHSPAAPALSPAAPALSPAAPARRKAPPPLPSNLNYQTLGSYSGMEGVPFVLNSKLRGLPCDSLGQLPVIKARTKFELDREYSYNFTVERQT